MLKLKLQCFGHLMRRTDSLEMTLMLGKIEGKRRKRWQKMRWLDSITDSMDMNLSKLGDSEGQRSLVSCSPRGCKESDRTERLNNDSNKDCLKIKLAMTCDMLRGTVKSTAMIII